MDLLKFYNQILFMWLQIEIGYISTESLNLISYLEIRKYN